MCIKRMVALFLVVGMMGAVAATPAITLQVIPTVECVTPRKMLYEKQINASGTIEAKQTKEVYLETPIIADSVQVSVGDAVKEGQVIASIDSKLTKSVLEQSVAASTLLGNLPISENDASDLMDLYSAFQSAGLGGNLGKDPLDALAQQVFVAAKQPLPANDYLYIPEIVTAPMDGIVTQVGIQSNVLSRTANPIVTISSPDGFVAMVAVGESLISDVQIGDLVTITGTGFSKSYQGYVSKIHPVARRTAAVPTQETVVDVEIAIIQPDDNLKAGFTTRAVISTGKRRDILTIPYEAIQQDAENVEYVYVAQGTKAVRRNITTGMELLEGVEVVEGLSEEDVLVADASEIKDRSNMKISLKRSDSDDS